MMVAWRMVAPLNGPPQEGGGGIDDDGCLTTAVMAAAASMAASSSHATTQYPRCLSAPSVHTRHQKAVPPSRSQQEGESFLDPIMPPSNMRSFDLASKRSRVARRSNLQGEVANALPP